MGERERKQRVDERDREAATQQPSEQSRPLHGNAVFDLQRALGNQATSRAIQTKLDVTPAHDASERQADAVAREVVQHLRQQGLAPGKAARASGPSSAGAAPVMGAEGGPMPADLEAQVRTAGGGSPLPETLRVPMEDAFGGADFSRVRVHEGSALAPAISARAFTYGSDIHFAPGHFSPESNDGLEVLAHELTHVVQQGSGRSVGRKLWTTKEFEEQTYQSWYSGKSTAQKAIITMLEEYHAKYPESTFYSMSIDNAKAAIEAVKNMRAAASVYVEHHAKPAQDTSGNGSKKKKKDGDDESKRLTGMRAFLTRCDAELNMLLARVEYETKEQIDKVAGPVEKSQALVKVEDHYGDARGLFAKLGKGIDAAASEPGSSSKFEISAEIPIEPSGVGYLGFRLAGQAERGDPGGDTDLVKESLVKARVEVAVTGGAKLPIAKIGGELGGYIEARAKSGYDVAQLFSYTLYRRARESKVIEDHVVNFMWSGKAGSEGKESSERWSRELEERIFGALLEVPDPDDPAYQGPNGQAEYQQAMKEFEAKFAGVNKVYAESGGFAAVKGELDAKIVKAGFNIQAFEGRRIDFQSLYRRKGGAGKENLRSDSIFNLGEAQKRAGRSSRGFSIEGTVGSPLGLSGSAKMSYAWLESGHRKTKGETPITTLEQAEIAVSAKGTIPGGLLTQVLLDLVQDIIKVIDQAAEKAEQEGDSAAELKKEGKRLAAAAHSIYAGETGLDAAGGTIGVSAVFDLKGKKGTLNVTRESDVAIDVAVASAKFASSKRLLGWEYAKGALVRKKSA